MEVKFAGTTQVVEPKCTNVVKEIGKGLMEGKLLIPIETMTNIT